MAAEVVLGVLIGGAGIWKLMGTFSGGSLPETVLVKTNDQTSGMDKGWIMLICIVIVGCMILSINAEQIQRRTEEQSCLWTNPKERSLNETSKTENFR
ncbi:hypothetical protein Bca4012_059787 [Brassica carinata]